MTTLPQTISARPRPAQSVSGLPAVASPALSPVPYTPPTQSGMTGADVWRVIRQNLWIFAVVAVISAGIGFGVNRYLQQHYQRWTAAGHVKVQPPRALNPDGTERTETAALNIDLKTLMKDQASRMGSDELLTSLLTRSDTVTRQSEWLQKRAMENGSFDLGKALAVLRQNFAAYPSEGSSLITVSMTAGEASEAKGILEEIVNTHLENLNSYRSIVAGRSVANLEQYAADRKTDLDNLDREIRRLGASTNGNDNQGASMLSQNLVMLASDQSKATGDLVEAQQASQSAKEAVARGMDPSGVEAMVDRDPNVRDYRQRVTMMQTQIDVLSRTQGPNSQTVRDLQRELDNWRDNVRNEEQSVRAQARGELMSGLESALAQAQERVDQLKAKENALSEQLNTVRVASAEYEAKRDEYRAKQQQYGRLMQEVQVAKFDAISRPQEEVTWADRPITPPTPSFPDLKLTVGLCTMLGLGLAAGLAFLREILDTSVRSPRDIGRVGQMNVLGTVPDAASDPESGDPLELSIANAPHSITAEEYRKVRSRLGHVTPLETTRTILVTSPQPGDGKTTVACNLAAGMALNGRKILLVDANFRRPAVHKVFDFDNDTGLADVLGDVHRFDDLVRETSVPNLYVLPAGRQPSNPTELIEGAPFTEFVDAALDEFDHVIFDSGPILFVSETGALAPQCDGVVSVVRARKSSRGLLGRMRDSLRSLNVEHLGVVLNAVRHQAGGYYSRNIKTFYAYQREGGRDA